MNVEFPKTTPDPQKQENKKKVILGLVILALVLLLIILPQLLLILALIGAIAGLIAVFVGRVPGIAGANRQTAVKGTGLLCAFVIVAGIAVGVKGPAPENNDTAAPAANDGQAVPAEPAISSETPTPTPSPTPTLTDYIGQECESDDLVMEQGLEQLFCDQEADGSLVWVTTQEHERLVLAEQEAAEKAKAKAAAEQAEKEAAAKKAAEQKAAKEKAAAEKAAAEKKAKQETEKKAAPRSTPKPTPKSTPKPEPVQSRHFKNCSEARSAGAAPVYRGEPGYGKHLDRDGEGVGCE